MVKVKGLEFRVRNSRNEERPEFKRWRRHLAPIRSVVTGVPEGSPLFHLLLLNLRPTISQRDGTVEHQVLFRRIGIGAEVS